VHSLRLSDYLSEILHTVAPRITFSSSTRTQRISSDVIRGAYDSLTLAKQLIQFRFSGRNIGIKIQLEMAEPDPNWQKNSLDHLENFP
jgi:hypothetical protein